MPKFLMQPLIGTKAVTARLGANSGSANWLNDKDVDKPVKLVAESRYDLCALGDPIEGFVSSVDTAPADGFSTGGVFGVERGARMYVTADGSQAAGTGALAVGDYVVAGTAAALGTAVGANGPKVRKATLQPFATQATLADAATAAKTAAFGWRVVSLGTVGTGAVGTQVCIERV